MCGWKILRFHKCHKYGNNRNNRFYSMEQHISSHSSSSSSSFQTKCVRGKGWKWSRKVFLMITIILVVRTKKHIQNINRFRCCIVDTKMYINIIVLMRQNRYFRFAQTVHLSIQVTNEVTPDPNLKKEFIWLKKLFIQMV